jgi:hypothetical protein
MMFSIRFLRVLSTVCIVGVGALGGSAARAEATQDSQGRDSAGDLKKGDFQQERVAAEEGFVDTVLSGAWLDPDDPFWAPRRGERIELALFLGGEGATSGLVPDRLPTLGGLNIDAALRYYPVDRLAVVLGGRIYLGLDGVPAPGTTAATVLSGTTGVRYDLVRENRFSLLWDLYSGPSIYVFSDLATASDRALTAKELRYSIGGEMGTALAMRYSLGPWTGELRGLFGGRAGSVVSSFRRDEDGAVVSGPFSSVYSGVDVGVTWSL